MAIEHGSIKKPFLILCEGMDTEKFLISYLNSKELQYDTRFRNDIQTFDFNGINELAAHISSLKNMEHFEEVTHLLVLRDAETDVNKAVRMVQKAFRQNGLPVPENNNEWKYIQNSPCTAFTLLPACSKEPETGALEDLCWKLLVHNRLSEFCTDVQDFVNLAKEKYNSISAHEHKSRLHTFFSVNEKYISLKIGEAAKAGAFDWSSHWLVPLRELISEGFEQ